MQDRANSLFQRGHIPLLENSVRRGEKGHLDYVLFLFKYSTFLGNISIGAFGKGEIQLHQQILKENNFC